MRIAAKLILICCGLYLLVLAVVLAVSWFAGRLLFVGDELNFMFGHSIDFEGNSLFIKIHMFPINLQIVTLAVAVPVGVLLSIAAFLYAASSSAAKE